jgi:outer membrane protein TolC
VNWALIVSGALVGFSSPAQDPAAPAAEAAPEVRKIGLGAAVATALDQNFSMLDAVDDVASSRMQETVARAQFFPKLTPSYGHSEYGPSWGLEARQKLPYTGGSLTASAGYRSTNPLDETTPFPRTSDARFVLTQPLLRGFGPNAAHDDLRNKRRSREGFERSWELTRQRVALDVTSAFYQVVLQRQLLAVARQSLKRAESLLQASQARLEVGLVSKLDVFRAELLAAQAQEAMLLAETSLETELERFRARMGLSATAAVEPEDVALPEDPELPPVEPIEALVARAHRARIDLAEAEDRVDDRRRAASLARQNLLPQLDLSLSLNQVGFGNSWSSAWRNGSGDRRFLFGLSSSYPLERSAAAADRATAVLDVESSRRALRQKQLDVEAEVRSAVRHIERLGKSIELQKKAVSIAEQQQQLATLRYQRGLASNFDVVDAEGNLVVARSALVGLLTNHRLARYELLRVTGGLDVDREFLR